MCTHHDHINTRRPLHKNRYRKTTTATPLLDEDYDDHDDQIENSSNETTTVRPSRKPIHKAKYKHEKRVHSDSGGFWRTMGFSLTLGMKKGLNLRIGPLDEEENYKPLEHQDGHMPLIKNGSNAITNTTHFIPSSINSTLSEKEYTSDFGAPSPFYMKPAMIHPRAGILGNSPDSQRDSLEPRHVVINGQSFLLVPANSSRSTTLSPVATMVSHDSTVPPELKQIKLITEATLPAVSKITENLTTLEPVITTPVTVALTSTVTPMTITVSPVKNSTLMFYSTKSSQTTTSKATTVHVPTEIETTEPTPTEITTEVDQELEQMKSMMELSKAIDEFLRVVEAKRRTNRRKSIRRLTQQTEENHIQRRGRNYKERQNAGNQES